MTRTSTHRYLGVFLLLLVAACGTTPTPTSDDTRPPLTDTSSETAPTTTRPGDTSSSTDDSSELPPRPDGLEAFTPRIIVYPDRIVLDEDLRIPLDDGLVPDEAKAGGDDSMLITPLDEYLAELVDKSPMLDTLIVTAHTSVPYRLLTEIMYTAAESGFERFDFQTFGPGSEQSSHKRPEPAAPARRAQ